MTIQKVVENGFCIGCGVCRAADRAIQIRFNELGDLVANLPSKDGPGMRRASRLCPFSDDAPSEDRISARVFGRSNRRRDPDIGYYRNLWSAYAPELRATGSSGGIVTWLLEELLRLNVVDRVIHVAPAEPGASDGRIYKFCVSEQAGAIRKGAAPFFYPVSYDEAIDCIASNPGRYAITGLPCFHKALRQLRAESPLFDERIVYQIGLACGHMKSAHYLGHPAYRDERAGDRPAVPAPVTFKRLVPTVEPRQRRSTDFHDSWSAGYFQPRACDFCDDVFAETADIAAMDAQFPSPLAEGKTVIVVRDRLLENMLKEAADAGTVVLETIKVNAVKATQAHTAYHRRAMLGYRRWLERESWSPRKRLRAHADYPLAQRLEQRVRGFLRSRSRTGAAGADGASLPRRFPAAFESVHKLLLRWSLRSSTQQAGQV